MPTEKTVYFKPTAKVRAFKNSSHDNKEEMSKIYYTKKELDVFNLEARAICTLSQDLPGTTPRDSILRLHCESNDAEAAAYTDRLRGLEQIMYPKRKLNKYLAQRSLLKYQTILNSRPNMTSEQKHRALAAASTKLNSWSVAVAVETGRLDALRAYSGDYMIPIVASQAVAGSISIDSPLISCCKKRNIRRNTSNAITPEHRARGKNRKFVV